MRGGTCRLGAARRLATLGLAAALSLSACSDSPPQFNGTDITGTHLGRDLALTDHNGQARTLASFQGKVSVVFFGFTQCPDVCPTTLAQLGEVMRALGRDAERVQVVMVSVDPERDTPEVLKQYMAAFHPGFLGLRGDEPALKQTAASFRAYFAKAPQPDGGYTMDHTGSIYLIDPAGEARVLASGNVGTEALVQDIRALL